MLHVGQGNRSVSDCAIEFQRGAQQMLPPSEAPRTKHREKRGDDVMAFYLAVNAGTEVFFCGKEVGRGVTGVQNRYGEIEGV